MSRCNTCLSRSNPLDDACPVCGIFPYRIYRDLPRAGQRVFLAARVLRILCALHVIGAVVLLVMFMIMAEPLRRHDLAHMKHPVILGMTLAWMLAAALLSLALAVGIWRFRPWSWRLAMVTYALLLTATVVSPNIPGLLAVLIGAACTFNPVSRSLLRREHGHRKT